jgi:hypothetical protein
VGFLFTKMAALLLMLAVNGQKWDRRIYYEGSECQGNMVLSAGVYLSNSKCNGPPVNTICEKKSLTGILSSEGTGCDDFVSDKPSFPVPAVAKLLDSNYLVLNAYANLPGQTPCSFDGKIPLEQNILLADGKCHAVESTNSYFVATCTKDSGSIQICSDSECKKCGTLLNAGLFTQNSLSVQAGCNSGVQNLNVQMFCINPKTESQVADEKKNATDIKTKNSAVSLLGLWFINLLF